jgi:putative nucleotidyltransferase with HDIG domain
MRLVPINSVKEGNMLAKSIYDNTGRILLRDGVMLTEPLIKKIKSIGIFTLYIHDHYSNNMIDDIIEPQLRQRAIKSVKDTFECMERHAQRAKNTNDINKQGAMKRERDSFIKEITQAAEEIMNEILSRKNILVNLVDIKSLDNYTYQHSVNVAILSMILGIQLKLSNYELYTLCVGAMLHDVGKMFVPQEIVQKNDKLTEEEYKIIKDHTSKGYDYLKDSLDVSAMARIIALQHHERPNGQGYPERRKGDNIHKLSKIVAIADVYDALTSDRPYRKAMSPNEALEYIMASGGSQFDYEMVKVFASSIIPYPEGSLVKLSTEEIAIVEEVHPRYPLRPKVKVVKGKNPGQEIDLENELNVVITGLQYDAPEEK